MTAMQTCSGCGKTMWNKFFAKIGEQNWHEECARCCVCGTALIGRCFERAGQLYCTEDYTWLFRPHCFLCDLPLDPTDYVYRAKSFIQRGTPQDEGSLRSCHLDCLSCSICKRRLRCGEVFSLHGGLVTCLTHSAEASTSNWKSDRVMVPLPPPSPLRMEERVGQYPQDRNFLPQQSPGFSPHTKSEKHEQYDFQVPTPGSTEGDSMKPTTSDRTSEKSETSESTQWEEGDSNTRGLLSKRPRTVLTSSQRRRFKLIFELSPKPSRKVREALAAEMELSSRVVQVWFQNQRAKTKKLARRNVQKSQRKCDSLKICTMLPDASYFEDSSSGPECSPSAQSSLLESAALRSRTRKLQSVPSLVARHRGQQKQYARKPRGENQPRDASAFHRATSGGWADEELAHSYGPRPFSCGPPLTLCAFTPVVTILNSGTEELVKRMECLPRMPQDVPATLPNDLPGVSQQAVFESTFSGEQARERDGFPSDIQLMNTHALTVETCTATPTPLMFRNFFNNMQMRVNNTILMD